MRTTTLRGGLELTEVGLGMAQFGNLYRETTDAEVAGAIDAAWDAGIRYFDTAPHYGLGLSERRSGRELAGRPRDAFVLSTKVGRILEPSPSTADRMDDEGFAVPAAAVRRFDFSRDGIRRSVEESLERLGLDRIDILYLHDPDDHLEQAFGEGAAALIELREEGLVGAVGAGMNHAAPLAELIRRADVDVVMCAGRYTLLDQEAERELLPLALDRGVGVVAAGVYNSGLLSRPEPADDATYEYGPAPAELLDRARAIARICRAHGVTLPEAAIAFPLRHPAVVSAVIGARTASQVGQTVERAAAVVPDALWEELATAGLVPSPSREDLP
ncbi:aldo/keto reductase [Pseudolysinimonas sp.]|uniref:aldo/keto reductase n=1 Tax=Pseudolysinimonas sp. TaxID=2680009 RepID=UPI003F81242C